MCSYCQGANAEKSQKESENCKGLKIKPMRQQLSWSWSRQICSDPLWVRREEAKWNRTRQIFCYKLPHTSLLFFQPLGILNAAIRNSILSKYYINHITAPPISPKPNAMWALFSGKKNKNPAKRQSDKRGESFLQKRSFHRFYFFLLPKKSVSIS